MKKQQKIEAKFDEMMEELNTSSAIQYAMTTCFKVDDIVDHPKFGLGKVLSLISPNKMQVLFRESEKIMVCVINDEDAG